MTVYIVKNKSTGKEELVESDNKAQAFRLIGEEILEVRVASATDVVAMMSQGCQVKKKVEVQMEIPVIGEDHGQV